MNFRFSHGPSLRGPNEQSVRSAGDCGDKSHVCATVLMCICILYFVAVQTSPRTSVFGINLAYKQALRLL